MTQQSTDAVGDAVALPSGIDDERPLPGPTEHEGRAQPGGPSADDNAVDVVFFQTPGMIFALWGRDKLAEDSAVTDTGGWGGVTLAHIVGSPDEVDAVLAGAEAAGATIGRPVGATPVTFRACRNLSA